MTSPVRLPLMSVALAGCGGVGLNGPPVPTATFDEGRAGSLVVPSSRVADITGEAYAGGIGLDPPPAGAAPGYSPQDTYARCVSAVAPCGKGQPSVVLTSFSDYQAGNIQPDGSVEHPYLGVLAWAITWHDQRCFVSGPASVAGSASSTRQPAPSTCDLVDFVDATTGKYLEAYQGPPIGG